MSAIVVEILTPVVIVTTSTPDLVEIDADATITIQVSPGIASQIIPDDEFLTGDGTNKVTMTRAPFSGSEMVFVGGQWQRRGYDYAISGLDVLFTFDVPAGIAVWIHKWRV